ncbi:hypothetical protein F3Y22_tig00112249pilonHSYRG00048 [Hibiscus syriacus]|uniref:SANT domain-containing protein n=1 Tax=Hibiscus syriacus TaxID=106335 RepID=A0A6A2X3C5_HIBSY|nr:hypothetical protein F3Y22_tig00112249pilonHSYRG00048 [Hibiscus syriacus]
MFSLSRLRFSFQTSPGLRNAKKILGNFKSSVSPLKLEITTVSTESDPFTETAKSGLVIGRSGILQGEEAREDAVAASAATAARWRDFSMSPYQHGSFRDYSWGSVTSVLSGHGRQGSWHLFEENGVMDMFHHDQPRDWRGQSWESCKGPQALWRPHHVNNERRSMDDMSSTILIFICFVNMGSTSKGQHDHKTSAFKSLGGVDSDEGKLSCNRKIDPVRILLGMQQPVFSSAPSDETMSRKKPRLAGVGVWPIPTVCSPATPSVACSSSPGDSRCNVLAQQHIVLFLLRNMESMWGTRGSIQEEVSRFISSNGLVEDPLTIEKERALINPWTSEEKEIFIDKLAAFGKDFRKIASFLDHKTTADWIVLGGRFVSKTSGVDDSIVIRSSNFDIAGSDQDTVAADVLAGICGSLSSEAMSSCITSAGPGEGYHHDRKCHKVDSVVKKPSTSDVLQNADEDAFSDETCGEMVSAHWTDEENPLYTGCLSLCKARKCLGLDLIHPTTRNTCTPLSDDANAGGTDTEDACVQESSVICGDKLGSNVEDDLPPKGNDGRLVDHQNTEAVEDIFSDVDLTGSISEDGADAMDLRTKRLNHYSAETGSQIICRPVSNRTGDESIDKNFDAKVLHQVPLDLGSAGKPSILLFPDESSFAKISVLHDSDTSQCENICNQDKLSSTLAYPEKKDKHSHKMLVGMWCSQLAELKRRSPSERGVAGSFLAHDYLHKCNSPKPAAELPRLVQKSEQANSRQKSHFWSLSDTEKPCRNGNVKLFGQILNSSSQDDEKVVHFSKSAKYSDLNLTSCKNVGGNGSLSKFDENISFAPENVPRRSYGLWDGNRIQTGLSSLPDSAILVAKYPGAFVNYSSSSSSQMEQQASQTFRNTDRNLNGVSVFTPREINSNGTVTDYQAYRGHDCTKVAPFTADVKQQQGMFSEKQRQNNGFDAVSNLQQRGRGMVGMNVMGTGGGGGVVGGSCSKLSDPVAVLRMQFAKTEPYGGQSGSRTREEESTWRGKGDMNIRR